MRKVLIEMTEVEAVAFLGGKGKSPVKKGSKKSDLDELEDNEDAEDEDAEDEDAGDEDAEDEEVTLEMIQEKCQALGKKGKMPKIKALMSKMKIAGISKMKPAQYQKFYDALLAIK